MLAKAFSHLTTITEEEIGHFLQTAEKMHLAKGEFFATPEATCKKMAVLEKGILRAYHLHDGKEVTDYFNTEDRNPLVSSFASFLKQERGKEYVEALTPCTLYSISYNGLQDLYL